MAKQQTKISISNIELNAEESKEFRQRLIEKSVDVLVQKVYTSITQKQVDELINNMLLSKIKITSLKISAKHLNAKIEEQLEGIISDNLDEIVDQRKIIKFLKERIRIVSTK